MNSPALANLVAANPTSDAPTVLALAQADARTVTPIPLSKLNPYFSAKGLTARLSRSAAAIASANQVGADQLVSFLAFVASAANPTFDTTDPAYAASADALFTAMIGLNGQSGTLGVTQDEATDIIAMGGGYLLKDATLDQVTAAIAAYQLQQSRIAPIQALRDANNNRYNANVEKLSTLANSSDAIPADLAALDALGAS